MPYRAVTCGFSSVLSLTTSMPAFSAAISSRIGETARHGPHHSAQKSTRTGLSLASTSASKVASVTDFVEPIGAVLPFVLLNVETAVETVLLLQCCNAVRRAG